MAKGKSGKGNLSNWKSKGSGFKAPSAGSNGEKGLGKAGKGGSGYGQNQSGPSRYARKRINSEYGGGK